MVDTARLERLKARFANIRVAAEEEALQVSPCCSIKYTNNFRL